MKIIAVLPAYNAERTLERTLKDIPDGVVDGIILGDDASTDNTVRIAKKMGLEVLEHKKNMGYGANQKTCYREALRRGADIVVMIHPDYQYDPRLLPYMTGLIRDGVCDVIIGSRIRTRREALAGGMPFYKYVGNRFLTFAENLLLGQNLSEYHSGFRAFKKEVLTTIPWEKNSDDFVFDQEILIQAAYFNFRIGDIPVPTIYFPEASSINWNRSVVYGLGTLWTLAKYLLQKVGFEEFPIFKRKGHD